MKLKLLTLTPLTLAFTLMIVAADPWAARADCIPPDCLIPGGGGSSKWPTIPPDDTVESRIQNGNASIGDYFRSGRFYLGQKNFSVAENRFTTAFQLAEKAGNLEQQAIAQSYLGALYSAFRKYRESIPYYEAAKKLYLQAGNTKRANEVQQRIAEMIQLSGASLNQPN